MVTEVKPVQFANARYSIRVTLLGIIAEVNFLQPSNAESPILVTPLGMVTEVKVSHA